MAQFLNLLELDNGNVKPFLLKNSERVKEHAAAMARKYNGRFEYPLSVVRSVCHPLSLRVGSPVYTYQSLACGPSRQTLNGPRPRGYRSPPAAGCALADVREKRRQPAVVVSRRAG